ncbi:hypothetical protein [Prosthecobacter sp.]|uniref:lipopolysaccharide biosynthesis protein n=1 Tax=Prosthecobacter sp. TaxID=1965333 RepID=UPI001DAE0C63|nr:hypothetical protein [Prosthecobacter sp.]MCB1277599.1 hypothetical protein [Prosthecobacter sp.]
MPERMEPNPAGADASLHVHGRVFVKVISSGLVSKALGAVLQLASIPLAIRHLGADGYGLYSLFIALFILQSPAQVFGGPNLTSLLSGTRLDHKNSDVIRTSLTLTFYVSVIGAVGASLFTFLSPSFAGSVRSSVQEHLLGLLMFALSLVMRAECNSFIRIETAALQAHRSYLYNGLGNALAAAMLLLFPFYPRIWFLITITCLVQTLPLYFYSLRELRSNYRIREGAVQMEICKTLFFGGSIYLIFEFSSNLPRELLKFILDSKSGAADLAIYSALMSISLLIRNSATLIFGPMIPAIKQALEQHQGAWIRRAYLITVLLSATPLIVAVFPDALISRGSSLLFGHGLLVNRWHVISGAYFLASLLIKYWGAYFLIGMHERRFLLVTSVTSLAAFGVAAFAFTGWGATNAFIMLATVDMIFFNLPATFKILRTP